MKPFKFLLAIVVMSMACKSYAESNSNLMLEIAGLSRSLEQRVYTCGPSQNQLLQVRAKLFEALDILKNDNPSELSDPQRCFEYLYDKYYLTYNSSQSTEKAGAALKLVGDFEVLQFLYDCHYKTLSSSAAIDLAVSQASFRVQGKLPIITYAYERYYTALNASQAATKAVTNSANVSLNALPFLKSTYEKFYKSYSASQSMDKAFELVLKQ